MLRLLFTLSMIIKGIDGIVELVGGVAFAYLEKSKILNIFIAILEKEQVFQFSDDKILEWPTRLSDTLSADLHVVIAASLIGNVALKIVLCIGVLMEKFIIYPFALVFLFGLLVYQIIQTIQNPSYFLYVLDLLDIIALLLVAREFVRLRQAREAGE